MHNQHDECDSRRDLCAEPQFQCPDVDDVPMACAWTTAWQRRVFHLHLSKMAGREVLARAPAAIDVQKCPGEVPGSIATFRGHVRPPVAPCFYSYETTWDKAVAAYASRPPPLVVTMIREPMRGRSRRLRIRRIGASNPPSRRHQHGGFRNAEINFAHSRRRLGSPLGPSRRGGPGTAAQRLDASVGLVEELDASLCLWEYQFGHHAPTRRTTPGAATAGETRDGLRPRYAGVEHAGKYENSIGARPAHRGRAPAPRAALRLRGGALPAAR